MGIEHGFLGGEGLTDNHNKGGFRAQGVKKRCHLRRIKITDKVRFRTVGAYGTQGRCHHLGSQIRAADTDVNDIGDFFTG